VNFAVDGGPRWGIVKIDKICFAELDSARKSESQVLPAFLFPGSGGKQRDEI